MSVREPGIPASSERGPSSPRSSSRRSRRERRGMSATVSRVLRDHVAAHAEVEYVVCDDERLTYAGAERRSRVLACGLLAAGAGRGSRIGLLFPTGTAFVTAWLATVRIGAIAVPISTFSTPIELRDLLGTRRRRHPARRAVVPRQRLRRRAEARRPTPRRSSGTSGWKPGSSRWRREPPPYPIRCSTRSRTT